MEVLNPRLSLELSGLLSGSLLPEPQLLLCASPAGARVPDYVCWARKRVRRPKVTLRPKGLQLTSVSDWAKLCSLVRLRSVLIFPSFNVTVCGPRGMWAAHQHWAVDEPKDVVALQELCVLDSEWQAFARAASRSGYHAYHQAGGLTKDRWGNPRAVGGVGLLVAKGLRQRLVYSDHGDFAQLLVVAVNGWHVGSGYAPPTHHGIPQSELCSLLSDWCCLRAGQTQKWILATDANETPDNSEILTHCAAMGAYAKLVNRPTRWKGNREIDFLVTNDPESLAETKCLGIKLSDHVPLSTKVRCCSHETLRGSLQPTPCFDKPVGVSSELWRDLISQHWNNHHMLSSLHEVISRESVCPDAEWTFFQEILNDCFRLALNSLASHPDAEVREDALKCLRRNSPKGQLAKFAGLNWGKRGPELDTSFFVLRRLRKNLARACELSRLLRLGAVASSPEVQTLRHRTGLTEEDQQAVEETIARWSSEVDKLTKSEKQRRLSLWRKKMLHSPGALGAWLKAKQDPGVHTLKSPDGCSETLNEASRYIHSFWTDCWAHHAKYKPSDDNIFETLKAGLPEGPFFTPEPPSLEEVVATARRMKSSAGPDGWAGHEICHLPAESLSVLRSLALRWQRCGRVPKPLRQAKMFSLAKPGKAKLGILDVEHTRPITVLNAFWRLWCSSWFRSSGFQRWVKDQIPPEVTARRGFDVLSVAAQTLEQFSQSGFLLSLDYSKCFDTLAPGPTVELMKAWGLPAGLADICLDVWSCQERWVSWQSCVHPDPLHPPRGSFWSLCDHVVDSMWHSAHSKAELSA